MKREEAMQILQIYKDELGQRIDKADAPDVKDVYQWQMDGFDMAIEALQGDMYCPNCGVRLVTENEYLEPTQTHRRLIDADFEEQHYASMLLNPTPDVTAKDKENARVILDALRMAKTVQLDRPHGEWIETSDGTMCGNCHRFPYDDGEYHIANWHSDFCPNCGADMR